MIRIPCRFFSTSRYLSVAVEKAALSALRKKTGYSFSNCKKALEIYENNIEKAEEWLKQEAQKEGWAKLAKMKDRSATKGVIAVHYQPDLSVGSIIELKCETDFVAKTKEFQGLAGNIAAFCSKLVQESKERQDNTLSKIVLKPEELLSSQYSESATLADVIAMAVGQLGENARLNRALAYVAGSGLQVAATTHPTLPLPDSSHCYLGQHGALLAYKASSSTPPTLAQQLCKHIVGMKPQQVGTWEEFVAFRKDPPPPAMTEEEQVPRTEEEGVVPKDPEEEEYQIERTRSFTEDEDRLLCQEFLLNPDMYVGDLLKQSGMEVVEYVRLTCGEDQ